MDETDRFDTFIEAGAELSLWKLEVTWSSNTIAAPIGVVPVTATRPQRLVGPAMSAP
jgi:hypothetical protein